MKPFRSLGRILPLMLINFTALSQLPPDPDDWVCSSDPLSEKTLAERTRAWCATQLPDLNDNWRAQVSLPLEPGQVTDLKAKNAYDEALRGFLRKREYDAKLNWPRDLHWRLTGPYVGPIGSGESYGVHPAVRVFYSPEVARWLCGGRQGDLPVGAMIIKEMASINEQLGVVRDGDCMRIPDNDQRLPDSWTVMVRSGQSHDGWYWANPTMQGDGNPPLLDKSAFVLPGDVPKAPVQRNPDWYPTGYLFGQQLPNGHSKVFDAVYPYSLFGAACINCHATAENELTFSSLDNLISLGLQYRWYPAGPASGDAAADARHSPVLNRDAASAAYQSPFSQPLPAPDAEFVAYYGTLGIERFDQAWPLRFPAETYDHRIAAADGPDQYLTSDQCINCHDATYANAAEANMLIDKHGSDEKINVSPYGEWRVSPMGLAGRDPIFFSQLQSETNNLPAHTRCIENTCLHCHGVMGQRQQAIDTPPSDECKDLFAVQPPASVPFGTPFAKKTVTDWQSPPDNHSAAYGALARDGISCQVCHQMLDTDFGQEASFTGNFVAGQPTEVFGPYDEVVPKPMQNALGITPQHGQQIASSHLCGTCHNILLPTFNNDGSLHAHSAPDGQKVTSTYEQTTHLEWVNSDFSKAGWFKSCQDCHMPTEFKVGSTHNPLKGVQIANIESSDFAPTTHRLPNDDIRLRKRDRFARHALHGLNVFINEMFQQFPLLLGLRQLDYMVKSDVQPALITGRDSMLEMARRQTAEVHLKSLRVDGNGLLEADVEVVNLSGHFMPSGVGFRRAFLEFIVYDRSDRMLWASGRTNRLGVILDGTSDQPLPSERGGKGTTEYQPHYQQITTQDQVQIYQELIKDSDGHLTTSFLRRVSDVKDNRLRGKGYDPAYFLKQASPYIQMLGVPVGRTADDPDYTDPTRTGSDRLKYRLQLTPAQARDAARVAVKMYNQSIPPAYLQDRFSDAAVGPKEKDDIQRLYYLTSHLNTATRTAEGEPVIQDWKLYIDGACRTVQGQECSP